MWSVAAEVDLPDTKTRVLDAALLSFGTSGYEATSLDDLAGDLGLRKQTILYHFGSKAGLVDAVVDRAADELVGTLETRVRRVLELARHRVVRRRTVTGGRGHRRCHSRDHRIHGLPVVVPVQDGALRGSV